MRGAHERRSESGLAYGVCVCVCVCGTRADLHASVRVCDEGASSSARRAPPCQQRRGGAPTTVEAPSRLGEELARDCGGHSPEACCPWTAQARSHGALLHACHCGGGHVCVTLRIPPLSSSSHRSHFLSHSGGGHSRAHSGASATERSGSPLFLAPRLLAAPRALVMLDATMR